MANIAGFITIGREYMLLFSSQIAAFDTYFPVGIFIKNLFSAALMTGFGNISASFAGVLATIRVGMLLMADATAAICTTGPVVEIVVHPFAAQGVLRNRLLVAFITDFLMICFIDVGIIRIYMDAGR